MLHLNILFLILLFIQINQSISNIIITANTTDNLSSNFGYFCINKIYTINSSNLIIKVNNKVVKYYIYDSPSRTYKYEIKNPGKIEINFKFDIKDIADLINGHNYNLKSIKIVSSNTRVTNMTNTFTFCDNLTSVDLSDFDISSVTSFRWTFAGLKNLRSVKFGNFTTNSWCDMSHMFESCYNLEYLDLSGFGSSNTAIAGTMFKMFYNCISLVSVILIILIFLMLPK